MRRARKAGIEPEAPHDNFLDHLLAEQRERFRERFGREMTPDDPLFFDEAAPGVTPKRIDAVEAEGDGDGRELMYYRDGRDVR
jgi:hypothetical protein